MENGNAKNQKMITKSLKFFPQRGKGKTYNPGDEILIKIPSSSIAVLNPLESYLKFSFSIPQQDSMIVPDKALYSFPWKTMTIMDGNQSTVLEQINNIDILQTVKNKYGSNLNSQNLAGVYYGRVNNNPNCKENMGNSSGVKSIFYNRSGNVVTQFEGTDVEVLYRFDCSGLLGKNAKALPLIALNGLTIRLELQEAKKIMREVTVQTGAQPSNQGDQVGKGRLNELTGIIETQGNGSNLTCFAMAGYIDNAGNQQLLDLPNATQFTGIILKNVANDVNVNEGGINNNVPVTDINSLPITVGNKFTVNASNDGSSGTNLQPGGSDLVLSGITTVAAGNRPALQCAVQTSNAIFARGSRVIFRTTTEPTYQVKEVEFIGSSVQTDDGYIDALLSKVNSGNFNLQYATYQDLPMNLQSGIIQNTLYIPSNQKRSFSILTVMETLGINSTVCANYKPNIANLKDYNYVLNGIDTPQLPIKLDRISASRISPLALIESEKALDSTDLKVKSIKNPQELFFVGRALGRYNNSYDLSQKTLRLNFNYTANALNQLAHNFIYHIRVLNINGSDKKVMI